MGMDELTLVGKIAVWALPVIFAITVHEVAHGWVASKLGDQTARRLGRITLNPISHVDPIGTLLVPGVLLALGGFMFGWAKPVPVNWHNLRNPKTDMVFVALAGPVSNLIMALLWAIALKVGYVLLSGGGFEYIGQPLVYMGFAGIFINVILMTLNLLPILPLDGGRVLAGLLPDGISRQYAKMERFGFPILVILIVTGGLSTILGPPVFYIQKIILTMIGL
ncbi:MAG: site-2 protease family protein [Piscirickettsiaceae bacterium]|nr:MAG: site-2 protease family protein [Piscirickettsiaceae bacterium]PCI66909.1 MAG: site-2 protease family protein [Piscirickettsiaceae bacterium]